MPAAQPRARAAYAGLLVLLFAYLFYARTFASTDSFLLLRDQIRDWRFALGAFSDLPLTGTQSTAGGASLGPIYYWVLWLSRALLGPWVHNLPHAGAWGIALLQGSADLLLLDAIRRTTGSVLVALAAVLLAATASHDLSVSATIWNPAVSVAFVKLAIALRLQGGTRPSLWWTAAVTAAAWFAVQAHSAALFIAAPVAGSVIVDDLVQRRWIRILEQVRAAVEVILLLQVPFLLHALRTTADALPTRALAGAASGGFRVADSAHATLVFVASILATPWQGGAWPVVLVIACVATTLRWRQHVPVLAVTVGPILVTALGFALWQGNYDEYWYLPLAPCAAITVVLAATAWRQEQVAAALVLLTLLIQPTRLNASLGVYRMPEYGPTVAGALRILKQTHVVRRLDTSFQMPPFSDATFPYQVMGGTFSAEASFDAVIDRNGEVQFRPVPR